MLKFFSILAVLPWLFAAEAKPQKDAYDLMLPDNSRSVDTPESNIQSVYHHAKELYFGLNKRDFFLILPFKGIGKDQTASFGSHDEAQRIKFDKLLANGNWQGISVIDDKIMLLDGDMANLLLLSKDKKQLIQTRTIAWDRVRPAPDRGGEPTKNEIARVRAEFYKNYMARSSERFTGMAYDSKKWLGSDAHYFFLASRVKGYPIVTMKCSKEDVSSCLIDRACYVQGLKADGDDIAGIALHPKQKALLVADHKAHAVHQLSFASCFSTKFQKTYTVDKKIKGLTSIATDDDGNLWLSTSANDDYNNASAFVWTKW